MPYQHMPVPCGRIQRMLPLAGLAARNWRLDSQRKRSHRGAARLCHQLTPSRRTEFVD